MKKLLRFFDRLEDHVRGKLSRYPIAYAFVAGTAVVLFWRGVWVMADAWMLSGPASVMIGSILLLLCGAFVSAFIGNRLIMSGLRGEKKFEDKTLEEIEDETARLARIEAKLGRIEAELAGKEKK